MTTDSRPALFVTGHAPSDRIGAFKLLAERENVRFALFGGRIHHGASEPAVLDFDHLRLSQAEVARAASSGEYRAVICGTSGRIALPGAYFGARRAGVPFILWASLWAQPKGPAGIAGALPLRWIYRHCDAVASYGKHVSSYVRSCGAEIVFEAPQAVDNAFWATPADPVLERRAPFQAVFVGRLVKEKGIDVLVAAWGRSQEDSAHSALIVVGEGPQRDRVSDTPGIAAVGQLTAEKVRGLFASSDVLVLPSIATLTFKEPWGLVVNEAMNQALPVIVTDAVGAAAGGLVRDGVNGLIVPAGDSRALAAAINRLRDDRSLANKLGAQGRLDVASYTYGAWADGFTAALVAARTSRVS
ncbi:MAG: glycosyltransferase family 4 protein [Solirubrobacterales bacterium]|nr:glycosyltransferase family 4 protein [Solirubrobacterales bacterium]